MSLEPRLVLVEDDLALRELIAESLQNKGFSVETFSSVSDCLSRGVNPLRSLYILDVLLGTQTGFELCDAIRKVSPTVPVLFLSALTDPSSRIEGLRRGGDDYLAKPFEMEELLLRISGMLKRSSWYESFPENSSSFRWGEYEVSFENYEIKIKGKKYSLTQKECMILKLLIEKEGQVVTRDEILDRVWGYEIFPTSRTVDNVILRLRKTLKTSKFIHSVRGLGYKFEA